MYFDHAPARPRATANGSSPEGESEASLCRNAGQGGVFFRREPVTARAALQREMALAPLARLLRDGHDAAIGEREIAAIAC